MNDSSTLSSSVRTARWHSRRGDTLLRAPTYGQNGAVGIAYPVKGITVDGDLGDWPKRLKTYPIERIESGDKLAGKDDLKAGFRIAFNPSDHALYVAVEVTTIRSCSTGPGKPGGTRRMAANSSSTRSTAGVDSPVVMQYARYGNQNRVVGPPEVPEKTMKVAVARTDSRIVYEWRIEVGTELDPDRVIGFDISVADKDKDGSFSWVAWGSGTQKLDTPDRCGEFLLVQPGNAIRRGLGPRRLEGPVPGGPSRPRANPVLTFRVLWRGAVVDSTGAYKVTNLPRGPYSIHAVDSPDVRVDTKPHVDVADRGRSAGESRRSSGSRRSRGPG